MPASPENALHFLSEQIHALEQFQQDAHKTLNALGTQELFLKWKKQTLKKISEQVGETYAKQLEGDWLQASFVTGDVFEELYDDIDMCLRHLKRLAKEIKSQKPHDRSSPPTQ